MSIEFRKNKEITQSNRNTKREFVITIFMFCSYILFFVSNRETIAYRVHTVIIRTCNNYSCLSSVCAKII